MGEKEKNNSTNELCEIIHREMHRRGKKKKPFSLLIRCLQQELSFGDVGFSIAMLVY